MNDASSKPPGNTWLLRHNQAAGAALLALLLALFSLSFTLGASPASADTSSSARISLDANLPAVSASGQSVTVTGTITNTGPTDMAHAVAHVSVGTQLLDTRSAAESWMTGKLDVPTTQKATADAGALSAGSSTPFSVTIPGKKLDYGYGLASLPLTVTVTDGSSAGASGIRGMARSTLALQNKPVPSPLQVTVVIPLTLPADPDLFGPSGAARAAAWERAIGPNSQVQQTLDAFAGKPVIFAVDPALLDPPPAADGNVPAVTPSESPSGSPSSSTSGGSSGSSGSGQHSGASDGTSSTGDSSGTPDPTSTTSGTPSGGSTSTDDTNGTDSGTTSGSSGSSDGSTRSTTPSSPTSTTPPKTPHGKIDAAVSALSARLTSLDAKQSVWWLPSDDPDLTALRQRGTAGTALASRDFSRPLPAGVKHLGDTRLVWPTGDLAGTAVTSFAKDLATRSKSPTMALLPSRAVGGSPATTATHRAAGTSGVLTYDEQLSKAFSTSTTSPGTQTSRLLTQSLALYQQSPGTPRSIALVAPRTGGANPTQLAAQLDALGAAHWVKLRTGTQTATALKSAPRTSLLRNPGTGDSTPKVARAALTKAELNDLAASRQRLTALQSVLVDGEDVIPDRKRGLDIIGSTRWRGTAAKLAAVADRNTVAVTAMLHKLTIRSSTINFFADSGDISITISNELNRPVHNVQLDVQPRKYLIRVTNSVKTVDIDATSRATAHFHIEAVGGGTVPLDAVLRAPDGTPLTDADAPSPVQINVHPTSGWIMWVLGVIAGLILVVGLWRAIRRGPRTASAPAATDSPTPNDAIVDAGRKPTAHTEHSDRYTDDEGTDTDD